MDIINYKCICGGETPNLVRSLKPDQQKKTHTYEKKKKKTAEKS